MAGWDRNSDWNRDVLEHVVALLFSLAGLADLTAGLTARHRRRVFAILSQGEAEAWAYVMGLAPPKDVPAPDEAPDAADDAWRLAASFRALALTVCAVLTRARLFAPRRAADPRADWRRPAEQADRPVPLAAPDTS